MTSPNTDIMDQFQAGKAILKYIYTDVIGPTEGKVPRDDEPRIVDRYRIKIDRRSGELSVPKKIEITDEEMRQAIFAATGDTVATSSRYTDGGFSISYKVTVVGKPDTAYIVQMRHHGKVASMDALMKFVDNYNQVKPGVIPMPAVYSIPGEAEHQQRTGFGRQITEFIPGVMAETVYPQMPHSDKLQFVRKMALAWQGVWDLPIHPSELPHQIGELSAEDVDG
ncbi:uncharacterized protein FIESC28_05842 [Fusarium coffeatum]|uniref:Aminoglycoside phosphotransferase domain-containing protein n=1 Tax=Fusarium coffeatum TaxID=231269 RepID=A0A366RR80_9HYPO|nr:uncharacterized protein FIESC28_05842 [Fusarium coffeatum]RBR18920.1 hypothetical protein FIESC28_05842 [Fusarium coffeatum]